MAVKKTFMLLAAMVAFSVQAQNPNPFKSIGKPAPEILSLSNGKYPEIFENDTLRKIGSVMFNTRTNKIAYFIETDTMYSEATLRPEIVSRWLSRDPLARKYPSHSPYNFAINNPIFWIDPDGREIWIGGDREAALRDVRSLVPTKYASAIQVTDEGRVYLDASLIMGDNKVWDGTDAGSVLLMEMVLADEKYLYDVGKETTVTNHFADASVGYDWKKHKTAQSSSSLLEDGNGVKNLSNTPRTEMEKYPRETPQNGFDGQVSISPEGFSDPHTGEEKRSAVVFHELWENWERTTNKHPYRYGTRGTDPSDFTLPSLDPNQPAGAHQRANSAESNFHQKSTNPGVAEPDR